MKRLAFLLIAAPAICCCCSFLTSYLGQPAATPPPTGAVGGGDRATATPAGPGSSPAPTATPFRLGLEKIGTPPADCSDSPLGLPGERLEEVAYVPSGFCFNGEIDLFESGGRLYTAQSLGSDAAFFITDVTDPAAPAAVGVWQWNEFTYTADVKAFRQGPRRYLVLSLEPIAGPGGLCGVAVVDVTAPASPALVGRYTGENTGSAANWCDTHTTQVGPDDDGDGAYIYVSSIDTSDLRVIDIRGLASGRVVEVGHYTHPRAGLTRSGEENFVHDTTIVGDRVYVAYWSAGLIILDRAQIESGGAVTPLNPLGSIAPAGLQIHHAYPTADGQYVFVEDEVNYAPPRSQLRLYDIRDLSKPEEAAALALDSPFSSPHNLLVAGDLLFVGWYTDGVRVFRYDTADAAGPTVTPYAFKAVRSHKTTGVFGSDLFDGIYGVRLHDCQVSGQPRTCVYASDLTRGLIILALEP